MITFSKNEDYIGNNVLLGRVGIETLKELLLNDEDRINLTLAEQEVKVNAELDKVRANAFYDVCSKLPSYSFIQLISLIDKNPLLKEAEIASAVFQMIKRKRIRVDEATFMKVQNDYVEYFGNFGGNIVGILGEINKGTRKLYEEDKEEEVSGQFNMTGSIILISNSLTDKYRRW